MDVLAAAVAAAKTSDQGDWWSDHSTLIVGLVGIVFSGFVGPTVVALWTAKRERDHARRALIVSRREDLRDVLDETAKTLGGAVTQLRPLLIAQNAGDELPKEPVEFLRSLVPLGQRLRLRLRDGHEVLTSYDAACAALRTLETSTHSQQTWDEAVSRFEARRLEYLTAGRAAVQAPVDEDKEI